MLSRSDKEINSSGQFQSRSLKRNRPGSARSFHWSGECVPSFDNRRRFPLFCRIGTAKSLEICDNEQGTRIRIFWRLFLFSTEVSGENGSAPFSNLSRRLPFFPFRNRQIYGERPSFCFPFFWFCINLEFKRNSSRYRF